MKNLIILLIGIHLLATSSFAQVAINTSGETATASAILDVSSTSKGILIPRMTYAQRNSISNPANGLLVYDTDTDSFWHYYLPYLSWTEIVTTVSNNLDGLTDGKAYESSNFLGISAGRSSTASACTGIGHAALYANTTGSSNTAFGSFSLFENTTGFFNVAVGSSSLRENISGNSNIAIGANSLFSNTSGSSNIAIGYASNYYNQTGTSNTIIGFQAGRGTSLHNKSGNIFLGYKAGYNETGDNKLYIENSYSSTPLIGGDFENDSIFLNGIVRIIGGSPGADKILTSDEDGNSTWEINNINNLSDGKSDGVNVFLGFGSGSSDDGNNKNTGIGHFSLNDNTTGENNTSTGYMALSSNMTSDFNSAFGSKSLEVNTGERNTAVGYYSLHSNTTGNYNTSIGYRTGYANQSGSNNTFIGYNARMDNSIAKSNSTALGNDVVITASNQVRIGNSSVTSIGGYVAWTNISDRRFKSNISEDVNGLDFILKLRPVTYNLDVKKINTFLGVESTNNVDQSEKSKIRQSGFIAQEVEQAAKETGFDFSGIDAPKNDTDHYGLRYAEFVVPLVKAVQEMDENYKQQMKNLQKENDELKARLDKLEKAVK